MDGEAPPFELDHDAEVAREELDVAQWLKYERCRRDGCTHWVAWCRARSTYRPEIIEFDAIERWAAGVVRGRSTENDWDCDVDDGRDRYDEAPASGEAPQEGRLIQTSAEFLAGFVRPDYLVDGIVQRRFGS